jgi:UPF0755 protein
MRRLGLALAMALTIGGCGGGGEGPPVRVVVPRGATLRVAADSLAAKGVIDSKRFFLLYARVSGGERRIRAGTYLLRRNSSWGDVLDALAGGKGLVPAMTLVEGWTLRQVVPQLARVLEAPVDSVEAAVRDTALLRRLDIPSGTLEGYLFPDTYAFAPGTSPRVAVGEMVARFEQVWKPEWTARLDTIAMSRHDVLTLASIVEREARKSEERPVIASVYTNRLRDGMMLQADPTVQYAHGGHKPRLYYKDLEIESPYNTYRNKGLPPGPIGAPGRPSIVAALYPAQTPYKFFVAFPDGHHEFTRTYAEHEQVVRRARRSWDSLAATRAAEAAAKARTTTAPAR